MPELIIGGIPLAGLVVALVELGVRLGWPRQWAPYLNVLLTCLAALLVLWTQGKPQALPWVVFVLQVAMMFLTAAGIKTTVKWAARG